jgi:exosortase A
MAICLKPSWVESLPSKNAMSPSEQEMAKVVTNSLSFTPVGNSGSVHAWRVALPLLMLVFALVLILYRETALAMVTIWYRSETFTHGFVVLPIVLWLVWRKRIQLATMTPRANPYLLLPLAGLALLWLLGDLVAVNSVTQLAMVAMLVLAVPTVLGISVAAEIAFPLAFMFFAVPIGEFMMPQLMEWTAEFTILALRATGVPVFREGLSFVIPSGHWSVVEACSGVRYLIASLTVGTLYAYLNYQSTGRRLLFVAVAILVPVVANWMRAYMIVMLGHLSGNTIAVGVDHLIYGWVFFGIVILLMFMIGARWAEPEPMSAIPCWKSDAALKFANSTLRVWTVAATLAVIVSLPVLAKFSLEANVSGVPAKLALGDSLTLAWQKADVTAFDYKPHFNGPSAEVQRGYASRDRVVGVYLGYYRDQDYSRKLVSSTNVLVASMDPLWSKVSDGMASATLGGNPIALRRAELRRLSGDVEGSPERLLVWQIYWINGHWTSNDYLAKFYGALFQLLGRGDDTAVLVVYAATDRAHDAAQALDSFLADNYGAIDAALRATAASR